MQGSLDNTYPRHFQTCADLESGKVTKLAGGHDFVAAPRLRPDGSQLAWVAWDHPNMPWDDTLLYLARVEPDGSLSNVKQVCMPCHHLSYAKCACLLCPHDQHDHVFMLPLGYSFVCRPCC